ncbi:23S rRNA (guanosine(2251)-2'-O)-methyltransferase RlmB [Pollutibacter soli]|uniref:23S rRNA (guanosine(2251)-2'-O)-methyltransferase RlmB n=1 Tax=Pollutibacter soli TaxID=3034157 RepID=UPI0030140F96
MSKSSGLIIGRQPVLEALKDGRPMERIYIQKNAAGDIIPEIKQTAVRLQVPVNLVPTEKLMSLSRGNHQGVVAVSSLVNYYELQDVIDQCFANAEVPLFLILDGVTDIRNIGGIARTAVVCGAQAIIIPDRGVGALNEEALKASAGALEKIKVSRVSSLLKAVDSLHLSGIKVYSSDLTGEENLTSVDFKEPCAIIIGSEDKGVQPYMSKAADIRFKIPMKGKFDSLNVSVATGIILFEAMKQRGI